MTTPLTKSALQPVILIGEDEEGVRKLLRLVLEEGGLAVRLAATGTEVVAQYRIDRAQGAKIALVLLDVQMPGLDGPGTLIELRKINPGVRCCFMTASSGEYNYDQLTALGAERVFDKPFNSLKDLVQSLRNLLHVL